MPPDNGKARLFLEGGRARMFRKGSIAVVNPELEVVIHYPVGGSVQRLDR